MNLEITEQYQHGIANNESMNTFFRQEGDRFYPVDIIGSSMRLNHPKRVGIDTVPGIANLLYHEHDLLVLAQNRHPNVATFHGLKEVEFNRNVVHNGEVIKKARNDVFVYYEKVNGQWLHNVMGQIKDFSEIDEDGGLNLLAGLFDGVNHFHTVGNMIHRDIKPSNLMLVEEEGRKRLVLMDHEICNRIDEPYYTEGAASPWYAPREAILCRQNADVRSDVALVGSTIAELFAWDYIYEDGKRARKLKDESMEYDSYLSTGVLNAISEKYGQDVAKVLEVATAHEVEGRYNNINEFKQAFCTAYTQYFQASNIISKLSVETVTSFDAAAAD